jgi:hypothetical protein
VGRKQEGSGARKECMKKSLKTTVILLVIGAAYFAAIELYAVFSQKIPTISDVMRQLPEASTFGFFVLVLFFGILIGHFWWRT